MLDELAGLIPEQYWSHALVYVRIQAAMLILPGFGEQVLPVRVKVALAIALAALLGGTIGQLPIPASQPDIWAQIGTEMLIGFALSAWLRFLAWALDIATTAIAATASLSQIMGVPNAAAPHPIGNFLHLAGLAILMNLGLPLMMVEFLADGLVLWPPGNLVPGAELFAREGLAMVAQSFALAMLLAAPFTLGGFLYQALSGLISRVMPALPVVFIGAPASILLALIAVAFLAPMLVEIWTNAVLSYTLPVF